MSVGAVVVLIVGSMGVLLLPALILSMDRGERFHDLQSRLLKR